MKLKSGISVLETGIHRILITVPNVTNEVGQLVSKLNRNRIYARKVAICTGKQLSSSKHEKGSALSTMYHGV